MIERPSVHERLLTAMRSSDLTLEQDARRDVDYLIALGAASQRNGPYGGSVMRLHLSATRADFNAAGEYVLGLTERIAAHRGWRLSPGQLRRVANAALWHHVSPACEACHGRGYESEEGTPMLSGRLCRVCRGSRARPIQRRHQGEIRDVIAALERVVDITEGSVRRLLR